MRKNIITKSITALLSAAITVSNAGSIIAHVKVPDVVTIEDKEPQC